MSEARSLPSFDNTAVAFAHKSNWQLRKAKWLFRSFGFTWLLKHGNTLSKWALLLGFKGLIRNTIFEQFCGGESAESSEKAIENLHQLGVGTILDYSVEGEETEDVFETTAREIAVSIRKAGSDPRIPFAVFKATGIMPFDLLVAQSSGQALTKEQQAIWDRAETRFMGLCALAEECQVRLFIDAEESWIQPAIDALAETAMLKHNHSRCLIYNTIQLYRHDRLAYLKEQIQKGRHLLGFKLVRGAYMEKERERAQKYGYPSPIQVNKESTDRDYDLAVMHCLEHRDRVSICIGTHNEKSSLLAAQYLVDHAVDASDSVYFSQLLGMSDHISFNLSSKGFRVAKYVPYGPIASVMPYLLRRAQENSSAKGQAGRELVLIETEIVRRKKSA